MLGEVDLPAPQAGPGSVLIQVKACGLTQGDRRISAGDFPSVTWIIGRLFVGFWGPRATTPGTMMAGGVTAVGDGVSRFKVGNHVFGACMSGGLAELVRVKATGPIALLPRGWSFEQAATLAYGAGTARYFLDRAGVRAGERVLVIGAGSVGRYVAQIVRYREGEVVTAGRRAGPDQEVLEAVEGSFDLIFDTVGAWQVAEARSRLRPGGRYVTLILTLPVLLAALGGARRGKVITGAALDDAQGTEAVRDLAERGAVLPPKVRLFSRDRVREAYASLGKPSTGEEVVVVLGEA
jgi:NADPH:quinone reductase-like Zn-dependent oxidoreductase